MFLIMTDVIAFVADGIATRLTVYFILFYFYLIILFYFKIQAVEQSLIPSL